MRHKLLVSAAAALLALCVAPVAFAAPSPEIVAAVADAGRPATDTARDADRKPAEIVEFAGVKPGMKVVDIIPGSGYFTRVLARTVGPKGAVIGYIPASVADKYKMGETLKSLEADAGYGNIKALIAETRDIKPDGTVDVVFIAQNYHDFHSDFLGKQGTAELNRIVFASLKPGGVYVIEDHVAPAGTGVEPSNTTHRIDPEAVKAEVTAAGFVFEGETKVLANPADDHSKLVFDPSIRGKTDQFVYKFRKPA